MYNITCTSKIILGVGNSKFLCEITRDNEDNDDEGYDDSMPHFPLIERGNFWGGSQILTNRKLEISAF